MKHLLCIVLIMFLAGCYTSRHKPVAFKREGDVECPEWAVEVEIDDRFYCVDRRAFEDPPEY